MKADNVVQKKSFDFAVRVVNLYKYIVSTKNEYVLSKQLLRAGTSIGANIEEAIGGVSEKDFLNKISISYKEARETIYWLKLLHQTEFINEKEYLAMYNDAEELCKILSKIQLTIKSNS